jgi:hypothetical protein
MPSLLESFYFVFDADTKGVKKGLNEGEKAADTLEAKLQGLDKTANKIGVAFVDLAKKAGAAVAAMVALGAVKKLVTDTADHTFELKQQAQALAVSTEYLSGYQNAIRAAGGSAEAATATLASFQTKLVDLARMPGGANPFSMMLKSFGLNNADLKAGVTDPVSVLSKLSERFSKLSPIQQQFVGRTFGIDQGTITLMAQGRRAFDEHIDRMKRLGVVTQQQAESAAEFKYQQAELGILFETVARELTSALLPPLTWFLRKITDIVEFLRDHKNFTIAFFVGLGVAVSTVVVPAFISAAAAVWAFLAPILAGPVAIAAIVAAIALLWDDVQAFMNGENSLIGEAAKKWPAFGDTVRSVVRLIGDELKWLNDLIVDTFKYFEAFGRFIIELFTKGPSEALKRFGDKTKALFDDIKGHVKTLFGDILDVGKAVTGNGPQAQAAATDKQYMSKNQTDKGRYIADRLIKMGWTPEQAAGIAGSILQESGGDPTARNKTSGAQGIAQWLGTRKKDFEAYAGHSLDVSTLDEQIAFMNYELTQGKERGAGNKLRSAQTPEEAARIHAQAYERAGKDEINIEKRQAYAEGVARAKASVEAANTSPINSTNSNVIANSTRQSNTTIQTGPTTIHTQATDAKQIAQGYTDHLRGQLKNAQDQHDDGVAA